MIQYPVHSTLLDNGESIAYRQSGKGTKHVLLIHGNMSSSVHWQPLMEMLEKRMRVTAIDLRGFGDSTYNRPIDSLRDFAEDIRDFSLKHDFYFDMVCGWSTGGGVALELACLIPDRVKKIFLLDSVGVKGYPLYKKDEAFKPILTQRVSTREELGNDFVQIRPVLDAYASNNRAFIKMVWDASIYHEHKPVDDVYEIYLDAIFKQRNYIDVNYALIHFNMSDENNGIADGTGRIHEIKVPVVIMHGLLDRVVPYAEAVEYKAIFGNQALLIPVEGAGHSIITDNLAVLSEAIIHNV